MRYRMRVGGGSLAALWLWASAAAAGDIAGSRDHPLVGRFEGAEIIAYSPPSFEEATIVLGPRRKRDGRWGFGRTERVEGRVTRIGYVHPRGKSAYEIYRNFRQALRKAGFAVRFECGAEDAPCGWNFASHVERKVAGMKRRPDVEYLYSSTWGRKPRYLAARLDRPVEGDVHVAVYVHEVAPDAAPSWGAARAVALVEVIEIEAMPLGQVEVTPEEMARDIARQGHVALYNIHFDHDSATLRPESEPALRAIATLLRRDPKLRLFVVGHTDATGDLRYNLELSRRRARAVLEALVGRHGIERGRLHAEGVGPLAPVASNATEAGRAKNRRVELVKQGIE